MSKQSIKEIFGKGLKKGLSYSKKAAKIGLALALFSFIIVKAPEYHSNAIRKHVGSKVVLIMGEKGGGSGFHVKAPSGKTYILTNAHICLIADKKDYLDIYLYGSSVPIKSKVVKRMETHDLCLIEGLSGVTGIGIADSVDVGETVGIVGHPGLRPLSLSKGEIIGATMIELIFGMDLKEKQCIGKTIKAEDIKDPMFEFIMAMMGKESLCLANLPTTMLNAISYGGNSGSPVVNFWGNTVGVLFAGNPRQPTDTHLVPLAEIKKFLKNM